MDKSVSMIEVDKSGVLDASMAKFDAAQGSKGDNLSAMYYLVLGMQAYLMGAKNSVASNNELSQEATEEAIQETLQGITSLNAKKTLIDSLEKSLGNTGSVSFREWLQGLSNDVDNEVDQVNDAIEQYQEALSKLSKDENAYKYVYEWSDATYDEYEKLKEKADDVKTHWYEPWTYIEKANFEIAAYACLAASYACKGTAAALKATHVTKLSSSSSSLRKDFEEKDQIVKQMNGLIADLDQDPSKLQQFGELFQQLQGIAQKLSTFALIGNWVTKATSWCDKAMDNVDKFTDKYFKIDIGKIYIPFMSLKWPFLYEGLVGNIINKLSFGLYDKVQDEVKDGINSWLDKHHTIKGILDVSDDVVKTLEPPATIKDLERKITGAVNFVNSGFGICSGISGIYEKDIENVAGHGQGVVTVNDLSDQLVDDRSNQDVNFMKQNLTKANILLKSFESASKQVADTAKILSQITVNNRV
jgi:hypothetical protein